MTMSLKEFVRTTGRQPTPLERVINGYPLRAETPAPTPQSKAKK